jgi:hypothetical protein
MIYQGISFKIKRPNLEMLACAMEDTNTGKYRVVNLSTGYIFKEEYTSLSEIEENLGQFYEIKSIENQFDIIRLSGNELDFEPNYKDYDSDISYIHDFYLDNPTMKPTEIARYGNFGLQTIINISNDGLTANLVFKSEENDILFSKKLGTLADIPETEMEFLDLVKETSNELIDEFEKDSEIEYD